MVDDGAASGLLHDLLAGIEAELPQAVRWRHLLHASPELGMAEVATARLVTDALPVSATPFAGTGRIATVGPADRPVVWVRAELDGLPMTEQTAAPYAATNGRMHACGHDVHMAGLLALTRAAHRLGARLPARLGAVFQPSEERHPSGALALLADAAVTAGVCAAVAAHLHPDLPWGSLGIEPGAVNAAADAVHVVVTGKGGHAAYPHRGVDPVLALAQVVVALHGVVGRRVDPLHGATLTVGMIQAGTAENVIPDTAEARLTIRALDAEDQRALREAVERVVTLTAQAHGCTAAIAYPKSEPPLVNEPALAAAARAGAAGAGFDLAPPWRSCGGDDFAHYGARVPALMVFVGLRDAPGFRPAGLHDPAFLPPDDSVAAVARALAVAYLAAAPAAVTRPPA